MRGEGRIQLYVHYNHKIPQWELVFLAFQKSEIIGRKMLAQL
jgi:hypothetical protein